MATQFNASKSTLIAALTLWACAAWSDAAPEQINTQLSAATLTVLKELTLIGNTEAPARLADHYAAQPNQQTNAQRWYLQAAQLGDTTILHHLGTSLATNQELSADQRQEGVVMVALAELMNNELAHLTARLLPDVSDITAQQVKQARHQALTRLENGRFADTTPFPEAAVQPPSPAQRDAMRRQADKQFKTPPGDTPEQKIAHRLAALERQLQNRPLVNPRTEAAYRAKTTHKNQSRRAFQTQVAQPLFSDKDVDHDVQAYLARRAQRQEGAQHRIAHTTADEQATFTQIAQRKLELVNRHRTPASAITLDEITPPADTTGPLRIR